MRIRWRKLVWSDSYGKLHVVHELIHKKYPIRINPILRTRILIGYKKLNYPELDSRIEKYVSRHTRRRQSQISRLSLSRFSNIDTETIISAGDLAHLPQILFGRRVFEVHGYTNQVTKKLKIHFKIRTNQELFDFLRYKTKDEIDFKLSSINLNAVPVIRLKDKNFNTGKKFQHFDAFNNFLSQNKYSGRHDINSVWVLLFLSLHNGVRPSLLLGLKWTDVITLENIKKLTFNSTCEINGQTINIPDEAKEHLGSYCLSFRDYSRTDDIIQDDYSGTILERIKINPDYPLFMMNNNNPFQQNSLSREIKKALSIMGFRHAADFETKSTLRMYGRKVLEIKGDHPMTIKKLKEHYNFRSKRELFEFLCVDYSKGKREEYEFKGKRREILEEAMYDVV